MTYDYTTNLGSAKTKILYENDTFLYLATSCFNNSYFIQKFNKTTGGNVNLLDDSRTGFTVQSMPSTITIKDNVGTVYAVRDGIFANPLTRNVLIRKYVIDFSTEKVTASNVTLDTSILNGKIFAPITDNSAGVMYELLNVVDGDKKYISLVIYNAGITPYLTLSNEAIYTFEVVDEDNFKLVNYQCLSPILYKSMIPLNNNKLLLLNNEDGIAFYNWDTVNKCYSKTSVYQVPTKVVGIDMNNNIWIQRRDNSMDLLANTLPTTIYALFDKDEYNDTQKLRSDVNKINNVLKTITNISNPTTNKNLLFESNAGSLFKKDVKNELTDNIRNTDIKSINFAKLAKIINKDEATKKVDVNKVYSYHLAAEKLYTEDDKINKKFELSWKKKLADARSEFKDLLLVEKLDPLSPNFIVNNKTVDIKKYTEENNKLITSLEIANETNNRIKTFGLYEKTWSTADMMNASSDLIFLFTIKWNYRSKKKTEYKSILAVKHIKMGDYSTFAVIDTFSSDFVKTFNIEKNITTPNMGDADFKKFVFGNTYVTDTGTFDVNKIKDKMTFFIIPKLRLPVSNLQEKNETYIVNILKIDGKLDLFVPNLSISNKIETKNIKITEELKNIETEPINVIDIDLYSTYSLSFDPHNTLRID
jgi:hypothetical protein